MKPRLLVIILTAAALFSGVVLWRVDRFVYGDRMAWAEAQSRSQISSMIQAIGVEINSARRQLATVNSDTFKADRTNWKNFQPYYAVALMTSQNGAMGITQMSTKSDSVAATWNPVQLGQYLGFLGKELESRGTVILRSFKDAKKNSHVAVIFAGSGHAYILVGNGGNFQSLIESQRGSMNSFSIVGSDGLTISHATPEYIGTVMSDSTLFKEIRQTGSAQGLGTYLQGKKKVFGMYEKVPNSTAYVISTVAISDLVRGRLSLTWQFVFLAIGITLIGAAGYFWYEKRNPRTGVAVPPSAPKSPNDALPPIPSVSMENVITPAPRKPLPPVTELGDVVTMNSVLQAPMAPKSIPPAPMAISTKNGDSVPAPVTPPDWQQEKAEAYRHVAAAMGQEMRAPLASILGFSQMVLSKTQDPDVVQAVESILREARSSRDVLDKLVTFSGERKTKKSPAKIEGPLIQALKNLDSRIAQKGVAVEKDFLDTSPWPIASEEMTKVFENILENAIEGMERMQDKVIKISTWESSVGLHVRIVDSGEGIDRENLGKVFEPFFTTRSYANHVGLGLPVSAGILKEHSAQFKIQSQRGKGTQVDIILPPVSEMSQELMAAPPDVMVDAHDLPAELPSQENMQRPEELSDMNIDRLLELPPEDAPLEFLEGMGFDDPPPKASVPITSRPAPMIGMPPPPQELESEVVPHFEPEPDDDEPEPEMVRAPEPEPELIPEPDLELETVVFRAPKSEPEPESEAEPDLEPAAESTPERAPEPAAEPVPEPVTRVVIDRPSMAMSAKHSDLDSYKVAIKRPGKRN